MKMEYTLLLLLESYRAKEETLRSGKMPQQKVWEAIAKHLTLKGTGPQCSAILRSLKQTYKSVKDHNNKTGNDKRNWQFLDIMEEIFAKKAWCSGIFLWSFI
ncbi:uncharacterized protein [Rhodnius prolixus]|uniref:uncharacterized protein n=1 Tax=Rhodnius prolixus TaxID=13249 RepID=UPI003D18886C